MRAAATDAGFILMIHVCLAPSSVVPVGRGLTIVVITDTKSFDPCTELGKLCKPQQLEAESKHTI